MPGRREARADPRRTNRFFHVSKLAWMQQVDPPPAPPVPMFEKTGVTFEYDNGYREQVRPNGERVRIALPDYGQVLP